MKVVKYNSTIINKDNLAEIFLRAIMVVVLFIWNIYQLCSPFLSIASNNIEKKEIIYVGEFNVSINESIKKCLLVDFIIAILIIYLSLNIRRTIDGKKKFSLISGIGTIFEKLFWLFEHSAKFFVGALIVGGAAGLVVLVLGFGLFLFLEIITLGGLFADLSGLYKLADVILYIVIGIGGIIGGIDYAVHDKGPILVIKDFLNL